MRGGGVAKLPLNPDTKTVNAFKEEWDFKYISSHGLLNKRIFVVPENTYVYFTTKAGEFANIEELLEIHSFIYNILDTSKSLENWWLKALRDFQGKGLFDEQVYNPKNIGSNRNTLAKKRAFYEPGDFIQDLTLVFKNNSVKPIFPMGAFQIPIPGSLKTKVDEFNENDESHINAETDRLLFNLPINLFGNRIFKEGNTKWTLFDALNNLGSLGKKKRLVIVDACRVPENVASATNMSKEEIALERRLSRSLSLSGRSYEVAEGCVLPPTAQTVNVRTLRSLRKWLGNPILGSPKDALKKAIDKLIAPGKNSVFNEEGEIQAADRVLLEDILEKAKAADTPIRGGSRTTRKNQRKKRSRSVRVNRKTL